MGKLEKIYNLVWYGDCDTPDCQDLSLSDYTNEIEYVFQVSDDSGWKHWSATTSGIEMGDFNTLVCGVPYIIKLKSQDNVSPTAAVTLPGVVVGDYARGPIDATDYRITDECVAPSCTFEIKNIDEATKTFDLIVNLSTLNTTGTNGKIQGAEIQFADVLFDLDVQPDPITFKQFRNSLN